MSIPRDLKVEIPGYGTGKFNAAYTYGGPKLTLQVVKELTGLPINHVVNVDYLGFVRAVDAIDCVYVDVDRRYYHSNVGVPASEEYAEINVQPGYQLLCGKKALQYVRYRHTDTDLVRAARQQDFLSAARQRVPIDELVLGRNELIDIFTEYTTSDISDKETMLRSAEAVHRLAQRGDQGGPLPGRTRAELRLRLPRRDRRRGRQVPRDRSERRPARLARRRRRRASRRRKKREEGQEGASRRKPQLASRSRRATTAFRRPRKPVSWRRRSVARKVSGGFPVFYPTRLPSGRGYVESNTYLHVQDPRVYHFKDTDGNRHAAYRMVLEMELPDGVHYFGVQGIRGWTDPPILDNPSVTKTIHGREYDIFVDGDRVKMIAWHRGDNVYWISNSLLQVLTNDQMVGMARSARVIIPNRKPKTGEGAAMTESREPIGVIGVGWVGLVTAACFAELGHPVVARDILPEKVEALSRGETTIHEPGLGELLARNAERLTFTTEMDELLDAARLLFVCVDTPPTRSGDADLSRVRSVVEELRADGDHVLVMKSTVPAGTGEAIRRDLPGAPYVSCPEFLKEGSAVADFMHPDRVVIGADPGDEEAGDAVAALYEPLGGEMVRTDVASAEMIKLASNAFLATKISFVNEIANVCEEVGADVGEVARGMGLDQRIGPSFLRAGIGYGGSCFPKDVSALKMLAGNTGYHFQLLNAVIEVNELQKRRVVKSC